MTDRVQRVVLAGLGYFSRFHIDAWNNLPGTELVGLCDLDAQKLSQISASSSVATSHDLAALVGQTVPDIVDIVAPPPAHAALVRAALGPGRTIICQKPFCTSLDEARELIAEAESVGTVLVVHENFRFQPWHREVKAFLDAGRMGAVYQARFALRPGDGRGPDAYLDRQPAFQTMPRLLVHETAVHFIDLFRWFFGDVASVYAETRKLNPVIAGEDAAMILLHHASGVRAVFDGNRLADHATDNPRRTMGELIVEGEGGTLTVRGDGKLYFRPFGAQSTEPIPVVHDRDDASFGGGCVAALIAHIAHAGAAGEIENKAQEYLHVMQVSEAAYTSAETGARIHLDQGG